VQRHTLPKLCEWSLRSVGGPALDGLGVEGLLLWVDDAAACRGRDGGRKVVGVRGRTGARVCRAGIRLVGRVLLLGEVLDPLPGNEASSQFRLVMLLLLLLLLLLLMLMLLALVLLALPMPRWMSPIVVLRVPKMLVKGGGDRRAVPAPAITRGTELTR
jgi:hypothetical protein